MEFEEHKTNNNKVIMIAVIICCVLVIIGVAIGLGFWAYDSRKVPIPPKPPVTPGWKPLTPGKTTPEQGIYSKFITTYADGVLQKDADKACEDIGMTLATKADADEAYARKGFDHCRGGWFTDNVSGYYMSTIDPACGNKTKGFIPFTTPAGGKEGVYCYGPKPSNYDEHVDLWAPV